MRSSAYRKTMRSGFARSRPSRIFAGSVRWSIRTCPTGRHHPVALEVLACHVSLSRRAGACAGTREQSIPTEFLVGTSYRVAWRGTASNRKLGCTKCHKVGTPPSATGAELQGKTAYLFSPPQIISTRFSGPRPNADFWVGVTHFRAGRWSKHHPAKFFAKIYPSLFGNAFRQSQLLFPLFSVLVLNCLGRFRIFPRSQSSVNRSW